MKKIILVLIFILITTFLYFKINLFSNATTCLELSAKIFDGTTDSVSEIKTLRLKSGHSIKIITKKNSDSEPAKDCKKIDLTDKYIMPGLIDAHTHLLAFDRKSVKNWKEALEISAATNHKMRLRLGVENSYSMLLHGFTTVRDLGNSGYFLDRELAALTDLQIVSSGPGLAIAPSQIDSRLHSDEYLIVTEQTNLIQVFEKYKKMGESWIKVYSDNSRGSTNLMSAGLLKKIIEHARQYGFKIAVHSEYSKSAENSFMAEPDSIEHLYEIPTYEPAYASKPYLVLTEMSKSACSNLNAIFEFKKNCINQLTLQKERLAWIKKHQYKIIFGSDSTLDFTAKHISRGDAALDSLLYLQSTGLSNFEILTAATAKSGEMLNLKIGQIRDDFQADLLVLNENPLINLNTLKTPFGVIKNGKIFCLSKMKDCSNGSD